MIIDDYQAIADNHARLFPAPAPLSGEETTTPVIQVYEYSDQDIADLLAALHELY